MTTRITGEGGINAVQPGVVAQDDLAANVVGKGPAFRGYLTVASLPNGSLIVPNLTEDFDLGGYFVAAQAKYLPLVAGYYQFNVLCTFASLPTNGYAKLRKNGSQIFASSQGNLYGCNASGLIYLNGISDYVEPILFNGSGAAINVDVEFTGFLVRAA